MSVLEDRLVAQIAAHHLPAPEREGRLVPGRKFRTDLYWAPAKLLVEVDGGSFAGGRHTSGVGFAKDCEKLNLLTLLGWRCLRVTGAHIKNGDAVAWIAEALDPVYGFGLQEEA